MMYDVIEIDRKDFGYLVSISTDEGSDAHTFEEYAIEDELNVAEEVLRWLGFSDEDVNAALVVLDDEVYVLTDQGRDALRRTGRTHSMPPFH